MHDSNTDRLSRRALLEIYQAAILAVNGRQAVAQRLRQSPLDGEVSLVAVGKAAQSMAEGARDILGERITGGLVISKQGHLDFQHLSETGWELVEGGHPMPNRGSLAAGDRLIGFLSLSDQSPLLFLISGGASSLVEYPVRGVDQGFLIKANDWLLGSGLAINDINLVRKGLSLIKGGGLLRWIDDRPVRALAISDVPGDAPEIIGSGLLAPEPGLAMALQKLDLPAWLRAQLDAGIEERGALRSEGPEIEIVANLDLAKQTAAEKAQAMGYQLRIEPEFIEGDAAENGRRMAEALWQGEPGVWIWGGETTVRLPRNPGRGGRNQHLALAAAQVLSGRERVWLLSVGTDGTDGPTEDAGALVDGDTIRRARLEGLDAERHLQAADAGSLLEATGDLITSGPTGTNVMDLIIGLKL
ncbi:MAG: DUF4147 domain-containing protein [Pseudomonadota bacterium]